MMRFTVENQGKLTEIDNLQLLSDFLHGRPREGVEGEARLGELCDADEGRRLAYARLEPVPYDATNAPLLVHNAGVHELAPLALVQ